MFAAPCGGLLRNSNFRHRVMVPATRSAAMTLDVYAGLFGDDLDAVAESLDAPARRSGGDILRTSPAEAPIVSMPTKRINGA